MKDDEAVRLVKRVFPGAELVGKYGQPSEGPQERRHRSSAPKAHVKPSEAVTADVGELCEAVDAMVQWFAANEPGRLDRPGWQRIVKALGVVKDRPVHEGDLSDPGEDAVGAHHVMAGDTERAAAYAVLPRSGTQREMVLSAIAAAEDGLTDVELAEVTGLYQYSAAPRRNELMEGGWVEDSGRRRDTGRGGEAVVWRLTVEGRQRLT